MKKLVSVLLAIVLIETAAFGSMSQSVFASGPQNPTEFSDFGRITGGKDFGSPEKIIIIQDLHCHPQAQKNISSIIEILDDKLNINNIYLEGAQGDVDISWLAAIKDKKFSGNVAQKLLESGKLTGAEYYAYKHNAGLKLKGIEDGETHLENLQRLSHITVLQPEISEILSNLSNTLKQTQKQNYGVLNGKLSSLHDKYQAGRINSADYYKKLLKYAQNIKDTESAVKDFNVNIGDYPEILNFVNSSEKLKKINIRTIQNQLSQIVNELKSSLPYSEYSEFMRKTNSLSNTGALIKELAGLSAGGFIDLGKYKETGEFIETQNFAADINPVTLMESERNLLKALQINASADEKEMLTVIISEMFGYFFDYHKANLASDDYKFLKAFGTENYKYYWQKTTGSDDIYLLDEYGVLLEEYYETNIARDKIFTKYIFNGNTHKGINLIVCGGFHTRGLVKEFEEKGISYSVITPKITQDAKIASEIYNEVLVNGFKTGSYAIALQVISQTGSQKQFVRILETLLNDELKINPGLNKEEFVNDIVNKICDVDKTLIQKNIDTVYNRPVNDGVKINDDGSISVNIFFENSGKKEVVEINLPKDNGNAAPYASIFGARYEKKSPFWEWIYVLPFSIPLMKSAKFKSFMKNTFLYELESDDINKGLRRNKNLNIVDSAVSVLFIASFFMPQTLPFAAAVYSVFKSLAFASMHQNKFNDRRFAKFASVFLSSFVSTLPFNLILIFAGPAAVGISVAIGIPLQILIHKLYNAWVAPKIAARLHKNYVYKDEELIQYFDDFSREVQYSDFNKSLSYFNMGRFFTMLQLFNLNRDRQTVNAILPFLFHTAKYLSHKKKSGEVVLRINESISSQLENMDESVFEYIKSFEAKEESFNFLIISAQKGKQHALAEIAGDKNLDTKYRLYAYALLRSAAFDLNQDKKKELTSKARRLIRDFEWKKDLAHIYQDTIFYNEELQAYVTAVYLIMVSDHRSFMGKESSGIFKTITKARFDAKYRNANSSLSFGKDYFKDKNAQSLFPEIIAHELAHLHLYELKFFPIKKIAYLLFFLPHNSKFMRKLIIHLQKAMVHELYADVGGYLLALSAERDPERFFRYGIARYVGKRISEFENTPEEHAGARVQFHQLMEMLTADHREIDYYKFAWSLNMKLRRNIKNTKLYFREFFFDLTEFYLTHEGYRYTGVPDSFKTPEDLHSNDIITAQELLDSFYASLFGENYVSAAPFWEWVYMLPGVSFFTQTDMFSKILSKTFLKNKNGTEIKNSLKTSVISKVIDVLGIISLAVFSLSGAGIAGIAAFAFTRAVIFSAAHKGFDWKAHWKDRALISSLAFNTLLFFVPFTIIAAAAFFSANIMPFIAAGLSLNILFHMIYNNYIAPALALKKASVAEPSSAKEKIDYITDLIKSKLAQKLNIPEQIIRINQAEETAFNMKSKSSEVFYSIAGLREDSNAGIVCNVPKSFLFYLYEISGFERGRRIESFTENLANAYESKKLGVPAGNAFSDDTGDFAKTASIAYFLSSAVTVPSAEEIFSMAENMSALSYEFSEVNKNLLDFISGKNENGKYGKHVMKKLFDKYDESLKIKYLFECIEFIGYILQSQTWLSPSLRDGQYGFMQYNGGAVFSRYERELAESRKLNRIFEKVFSNHETAQIIKTRQAALFEYISERSGKSNDSYMIIPDSILSNFNDADISFLEDKVYSAEDLDEREIIALLGAKKSHSVKNRYFIIDCSQYDSVDIETIAEKIEEYNEKSGENLKIREILLYNASLENYILSGKFSFETSYIFDFSKIITDKKIKDYALNLFNNIPAVYLTNGDAFVLDYGSRLDNFTIHYLYLLMDRNEINTSYNTNPVRFVEPDIVRRKVAEEYKTLYIRLRAEINEYDFFDGLAGLFYNYIIQNVSKNLNKLYEILNDKRIDQKNIGVNLKKELNAVAGDYRTLLNFFFYLKLSDRKDNGDTVSESEINELAERFNRLMITPVNSSGIEFSQTTVLTASGMSAVKTIAAMLMLSDNISSVASGNKAYYEISKMFDDMSINHFKFFEDDTNNILTLDSDAVFLDLISNSEEFHITDVKRIVSEFSKREYSKPFYLCIDNSLYPSFQFSDIFNGIDLPDNMYIIIHGSMQKMHQRGLEIVTSGFLTLMSNGHNHSRILRRLRDASKFTSSEIDTFRYIVLSEFSENNNFFNRSAQLNANASLAAVRLKEVADFFGNAFKVYHPIISYSKEQRKIWEENGKPGVPFFLIRINGRVLSLENGILSTLVKQFKFMPYLLLERDSYGFDTFTSINYGKTGVYRFNIGTGDEENIKLLIDMFAKLAFSYFMDNDSAHKKGTHDNNAIEKIYSFVKGRNVGSMPNFDWILFNYIISLNDFHTLTDVNVLKAAIVCDITGHFTPSFINKRVEKILSDKIPEQLNDDDRAVYISAMVHSKYTRPDIIKKLTDISLKGNASDRGAAAGALAKILIQPAIEYNSAILNLTSGTSGRFITDMLSAA